MIKEPVRIFPIIHDRSAFLNQEHPVMHPSTFEYEKYWLDIERKCIEGLWGQDLKLTEDGVEGGWRYMPPQLYFYINICKLVDEGEDGIQEVKSPELLDIAWIMGYDWLACRKFSGFEDDDVYTCHRFVDKIERGIELNAKEKVDIAKMKHIYNSKGELKKYVDAVEYLHRTFEKPMGLPVYENTALNYFLLGSRGIGKSFFAANAMILHELVFEGAIRFNYKLTSKKTEIVVGAAIEGKSVDLLNKFELSLKYLTDSIGAYTEGIGKAAKFTPGYFNVEFEGSLYSGKKQLINQYKVKVDGKWLEQTNESSLSHVTFTIENPQAAAGKRPTVIIVEEVGLMPNVCTVHGSNEMAQTRRTKFGSTGYLGTGGNIQKVKECKIIMENAEQYDCLAFKDVFEGRPNKVGRFIPAYYADRSFKDLQGNTNIEECFKYEMEVRAKKAEASTSDSLDEYVQSRPLVIGEMFLSKAGNVFPTAKLRERYAEVDVHKLNRKIWSVGHLEYTDLTKTAVRFINDSKGLLQPIEAYNIDKYKEKDLRGAVIIYEHPPGNLPPPTYKNALYKTTIDPVKDDNGGTSLYSILVHKAHAGVWEEGFSDAIVAEYIGRYDSVNEMHDIAIKLAMYYNSKIMPETNIPDFIRYCTMMKKYNILQPSPNVALGKLIKNPGFKYDVGIDMSSPAVIAQGEQLAKQWLLTPRAWDSNGQVTKTNIDFIYSLRLLDEASQYESTKKNFFDHVRSLMILAIWLSEEVEKDVEETNNKAYEKEIDAYFKERAVRERAVQNSVFYDY